MNKASMNKISASESKAVNGVAIFCACVLIISAAFIFLPVRGEHEIFSNMIRLHILANSDSQGDQELKLKVRDYILADVAELIRYSADTAEAQSELERGLGQIERRAREFIKSHGYGHELSVSLTRERYPTRIYGDYIFPSGFYNSLRIIIGEARGENWWCVLFPPICFSGATMEQELAIAGYSNSQISILRQDSGAKYEIRFKILETFSRFFR